MASPPSDLCPLGWFSPPRVGTYLCVRTFWPRPRVTVPNVAPGFHLPDALSEGIAPSGVTYFCVPNFWPRPRVSVPNVAPGFVDTTCCAGAGGGLDGQLQGGAPPSRTLRFHGRFGMDPLLRYAYRSGGKALTVQGQTPFTEGARLSVPLAPAGTLGVPGCLLGGGMQRGRRMLPRAFWPC